MKKYGDAEKAEVFRGREAEVVNEHLRRVAKPVSEFSDEEKKSLQLDLAKVRESDESEAVQPELEAVDTSSGNGAESKVETDE